MREPQPSSRECFVCGVENRFGLHIRFFETGPYEVQAEYSVPEAFQGYPGIVHGGIIATMLDETASRVYFRGDPPRMVVTAKLNIRYRKPVPVGVKLTLVGRGVSDKGQVCVATGEIIGPGGDILADAEATLFEVPKSYLEEYALMDAQGWKVYPENLVGEPQPGIWEKA
jgi:uncharacterized protein (TIGR00369 family)